MICTPKMFEKERRYSFKKGLPKKVISTPYFTLRYGDTGDDKGTNAVVVSKKVSKKAVTRNKIKRRILSVLKEHLGEKEDRLDIVIYTKPQINEAADDLLEQTIIESINKI